MIEQETISRKDLVAEEVRWGFYNHALQKPVVIDFARVLILLVAKYIT